VTLTEAAADGPRLLAQVRLLVPVAQQALASGQPEAAERLLSTTVRDFQTLAQCAQSDADWALVATIRAELLPALTALDEATGDAWKAALAVQRPLRGGTA
jgi:hypothetical protein